MARADDEPNKPVPPVDTPQSGDKPTSPANTLPGDKPESFTQTLRPRRVHKDKDEIADDPPGYQAERVGKRLDQLEREGIVLNHHTVVELRRMLQQKFKADEKQLGLPPPSRQVMDAAIKHRLS